MAVTQAFSGTETVTTTEHSMTTDTAGPDVDTTAGCYQAFIDVSGISAIADQFEFRVYEKVLSSSTQRVVMVATFNGPAVTDAAVWVSPPLLLLHGWDMTLKKVTGTDRSIDWSIRKAG